MYNHNRRTDIDTLRAIAVTSVIIFHLDPNLFPMGYLGVDMFFVISGYLITKSILKSYKSNNFSFAKFYYKRVKRILPVLLVVLFFSLIFALFFLLISDLRKFAESLITSLGFISNFYFWLTGGYFSTNNQLKPLLHLWSLSVEEQFYIFYPIYLYFTFKIFRSLHFKLLSIIFVTFFSFGITLFLISKGHSVPRQAIFFLSPFRVWQFGIGSIFAFLPNLKLKNNLIDTIYIFFALFLIFFNFFYKLNFLPEAIFICIGTSLILFKTINKKNYLSKIFNLKILIFIGVISYSLYLWHWPLISFLKYINIEKINVNHMILSVIVIFILSYLSWKFVEQPFLYKYSKQKVLSFVGISFFLLFLSSIIIMFSQNIPSRFGNYPNEIANAVGSNYRCVTSITKVKVVPFGDSYGCIINSTEKNREKTVLYGNSHAMMYGYAYKKFLESNKEKGLLAGLSNGCLPFLDINISTQCLNKSRAYFNSIINSPNIKDVIIGFNWYADNLVNKNGKVPHDHDFSLRKNSIDHLIKNFIREGKNVYLIGPIEIPKIDFPSKLSREIAFKKKRSVNVYRSRKEFDQIYSKSIKYYKKELGKNFLRPHRYLCDQVNCYFADDKGSFFSDQNHLSYYGSMRMLKLFNNLN
ncbi:acyltransferase family protein [Pelagibacteraceae bacterium]|nr:acyltransferase family protein [Pelagibacteraceae bacterium]